MNAVPTQTTSDQVIALSRENRILSEKLEEAALEIEHLRHGIEVLHDVGVFNYSHPLESAVAYEDAMSEISADRKALIEEGKAVEVSTRFTFDNSLAKGRKMTGDLAKLMLRAYNAEAENCVRTVRAGNLQAAQRRLTNAAKAIERYASMMELRISPAYHEVRLRELSLTADHHMKRQEEKEAQREERERLREERRAAKELQAELDRLKNERARYASALGRVAEDDLSDTRAKLESRIAEIDSAIEQNDYRLANMRAGFVYVISNLGSFGPGVVKIGLTRRLDPMERVLELSNASVPFKFDVHALFFSRDAVGVETQLHRRFSDKRVNRINSRKEYFYVSPVDVKEALADIDGGLLEFNEASDAEQYRLSEQARLAEIVDVEPTADVPLPHAAGTSHLDAGS